MLNEYSKGCFNFNVYAVYRPIDILIKLVLVGSFLRRYLGEEDTSFGFSQFVVEHKTMMCS